MRYRWKLLILFLLMTLVPMLTIRTFGVRAIRKLGDELISRMTQRRIENMQNRLELLLSSYSSLQLAGRKQIEIALMMQAREVERCLEKQAAMPGHVFFSEDYNRGVRLPDDITTSSSHFRIRSNGSMDFLKISKSHPVFKLPGGADRSEYQKDIACLASLATQFRQISEKLQNLANWHNVGFENGLFSSYPGHNGIPRRMDHRSQPWYTIASGRQIAWSDPYVDPATRQIVAAASIQISHPTQKMRIVTSLVVPIYKIFESVHFTPDMPLRTRAFMCYLPSGAKETAEKIRIYVREEYTDMKHRRWRTPLKADWLISDDATAYRQMVSDFASGKGNIRKMAYEGKECLWVYGPSHSGFFLVFITPFEQILKDNRRHEEYIHNLMRGVLSFTRYSMILIVGILIVAAFLFSRTITRPIQALVESARRLARGDFDARVNITTRDEFGDMGKVFNSIGPRLKEHYEIKQSLALASEVQRRLIPRDNPRVPGLDIAGTSIYCHETGGDYLDYLNVDPDNGRIGIVVGDVSDHGIPSALLMTTTRALLRQRSAMPGNLQEIVTDVNVQLVGDIEDSGNFMTLFYCRIDTHRQTIRWIRAGQDPAFLYDEQSSHVDELTGKGLPLGIFENTRFEEMHRPLASGQIIVIGTDGIWETTGRHKELFGKDRLHQIVRTNAQKTAADISRAIITEVDAFRIAPEWEDDLTLVVIKVNPRA